MSAACGVDGHADARLALTLLTLAPERFGGICLRGGGPARDAMLEEVLAGRGRKLPAHVDDERLLGGVDIAASLAAGQAVRQQGLLAEMKGGILIAPMAERMGEALAGRLAQALDEKALALVLLDDGIGDEVPPAALMERLAFHVDLRSGGWPDPKARRAPIERGQVDDAGVEVLAATALALGVDSARAWNFASAVAEYAGAEVAARLVLAPRATRLPDMAEPPPPPPDTSDGEREGQGEKVPEDVVLEAAMAAIPADLLARLAAGSSRRAGGSGSGQKHASKLRGKPLGARPGMPRGGARLALVDTLRAAVPWQALRRCETPDREGLIVRKGDLKVRRFEEKASSVTLFCVDASGSAAAARLAEAKGAVERLLAQAYVARSEVALIAFRGGGADLLLPPTRSLTRARRALAELPGGGGTPLAAGAALARQVGDGIKARGRTPFVVFLTDGSANIASDGTPGRAQAGKDAEVAAKSLAASGLTTMVIDISPRPRPDAERFAAAMGGRYLPLPHADAAALERAVRGAQE